MRKTGQVNGSFDSHLPVDISFAVAESEEILPGLRIPPKFREGLARIGAISDEAFDQFLGALADVPSAETATALALQIEDRIPSESHKTLASIIQSLSELQEVKRSSHVDAQIFVNDIWKALEEDSPHLIENNNPDVSKDRLCKLVTGTEVQLISTKIAELRSEVERSYWDARVLTDVRAAFGADASIRPSAATILHTLEIKYHDDTGRHREFYVALDNNDLTSLKKKIERAEIKAKTLSELLTKADFQVYED